MPVIISPITISYQFPGHAKTIEHIICLRDCKIYIFHTGILFYGHILKISTDRM